MVLFIKPENGKLIELNLSVDITIEKLKQFVQIATNIPIDKQILSFKNQILKEGELYHYLIPEFSKSGNGIFLQSMDLEQQKKEIINLMQKQVITIDLQIYREKLKIFIKTEKRIADFEVEPHEAILVIKQQLSQIWKVPVKKQSLRFAGKLLQDNKSFEDYDIRSGDILSFSLKPQQYHFQTQDGYSVVVTQLNSNTDINQNEGLQKKNPNDIWITTKPKL